MSGSDSDTELQDTNDLSEQEEDEPTNQERTKIRDQLSTMSFEDLQKLKNEMGAKLYNKTVFGAQNKSNSKISFKRANKNRPREVSSKKHVRLENNAIPVKKQPPRDPRFDPLCGTFDRKTFKDNYKFVNDIRKKEKVQLEKQLRASTDPEEKKKIKFVLQRLENQIREQEKKERMEQQDVEEKKAVREKLKQGEKVHFKKKSVKKLENLISKYEELKKTNKLQKHIEKRSKKLSVKERRKLERQKLIT